MLKAAAEQDLPAELQPLEEYDAPSTPTPDLLKGWLERVKDLLRKEDAPPFMDEDELRAPTPAAAEAAEPPPACGLLLEQLDATLADWAAGRGGAARLHLFVPPPCEGENVLSTWAARHQLQTIPPPPRDALIHGDELGDLPDLTTGGTLVIPELGRWFLRHRTGLAHVRGLLEGLATTERRVLVGCNSWAWAFLKKAVDANATLPPPRTFRALHGDDLRTWFARIGGGGTFRLPKSGDTLDFDDADNAATADFFKTLAAESRGIPWVAWQLWHDMLRAKAETDDDDAEADDGTLWVVKPKPLKVPNRHEPDELLVLQTLLIHGPLTLAEVDATVPTMNVSGIAQSLKQAGAAERDGDTIRCRPAAYPAVRTSLSDAGFPMGEV